MKDERFEIDMGNGEIIAVEKMPGLNVEQTGKVFIEMIRSQAHNEPQETLKNTVKEMTRRFQYMNSIGAKKGTMLFESREALFSAICEAGAYSRIETEKHISELTRCGLIKIDELRYGVIRLDIPDYEAVEKTGALDLFNFADGKENKMKLLKMSSTLS